MTSLRVMKLQRAQEVQNILLLLWAECIEVADDLVGLRAAILGMIMARTVRIARGLAATVAVLLNSLQKVGGAAVMQEKQALSDPPKRCGAELVPARRPLANTIRQI